MRILMTGSTGFLGSALSRYWISQGHELCLLIRPTSNTARIDTILSQVKIERITCLEDGISVLQGYKPDAVVHTACVYGRGGESFLSILDANIRLGLALLQGAVSYSEKRTLFINTGTVLSSDVSLYALSKIQFSQWGAALAAQYSTKIQFLDVLLQQMYGPGDDRTKFTTHVIEACRLGEDRLALTPGEQKRDFIYIDDVVRAYDSILRHHDKLAVSDAIEVGSGSAVTMREFVETVRRIAKANTFLDFGAIPYRRNEAMLCIADTSRLRSLGWVPKYDLESGLAQTMDKLSLSTL